MKKIYSLLLLSGLLLLGAQNVLAGGVHTFDGTEKLYFRNISTTNIGDAMWKVSSGNVYAYFFYEPSGEPKQEAWAASAAELAYGIANAEGAIYSITIPAGTWAKVILTRGTESGWSGKWSGDANQTYDIELYDDAFSRNYIVNYDDKNASTALSWAAAPFCLTGIGDDWDLYKNPFDDENQVSISLDAGWHSFKITSIYSYTNATWYGKGTESSILTPSLTSVSGLNYTDNNGNPANVMIHAIVPGEYTFTWDDASKTISVTYPTTYTRSGLTAGAYGTLCLPVDGTVTGATLYNIAGKDASVLYLTENSNPTYATRGVPYIFKLGNSDTEISVALNNSYYTETAGTANGLHGVYAKQAFESPFDVTNTYIVTNTEIQKASAASGVLANRAYIELDEISGGAPSAPGRPIIAMPLGENGATSIDAIDASEKAVKFVENGKLFIKKNGVVYDTTGRVVR